jgi:hypothetical protein
MMRLDIDEEGNEIPDWQEQQIMAGLPNEKPKPITPKEVETRFDEEKGQTTK